MHRVLQAHGNNTIKINRWVKNRPAQQWFFDCDKMQVKNQNWKNYHINIPGNGRNNDINIRANAPSAWYNMWKVQGAFIVNPENGKVFDVHGGADQENRNAIVWNKHGGINQ